MADASLVTLIKAHAYGNDFLIAPVWPLDPPADEAEFARQVCDRHRGIGADGLMLTGPAPEGAWMRLRNADGSPSEISGNGVRCIAAWLADRDHHDLGRTVVISTDAGAKALRLLARDGRRLTFQADMGPPTEVREVELTVGDDIVRAVVLRVGNPQCVILGPATPDRLVRLAGPLAVHPFFRRARTSNWRTSSVRARCAF